jgi:hypothetical protein
MAGPFTYPVAKALPFDSVAAETTLVGDNVQEVINLMSLPTASHKPEFLGNGELDKVTIYRTSSQITANRLAVVQLAYDGNLNPTSETWTYYSPLDGTTVIKTIVLTHTFTGVDLTNTTTVTT